MVQIIDLPKYLGQEVEIHGFIERVRNQKLMQFVVMYDQTGEVQVTNERRGDNLELLINSLEPNSTVNITGTVVENPSVRLNGYEIIPTGITKTSTPVEPSPINESTGLDQRLDYRWVDLRRPEIQLIFRIQTTAEAAMRDFWRANSFIEIHSPKILPGASEGGAELFQIEYFGQTACLAQSPQFYKQMAMAANFGKVFEIGPVFRANPSMTVRHDTEFTSVDMEISWIKSHHDIMNLEQEWLNYVLDAVKQEHGKEIKHTYGIEVIVPQIPFPVVTMKKAQDIIRSQGYKNPKANIGDMDPESERVLGNYLLSKEGHEFVFVVDYPVGVRPFYHMRHEGDRSITKSFDLIWKGMEVTTGAQREHRYDILRQQAIQKGVDLEGIQSYLDSFKYGMPPHGGLGFGLTRMLMNLTGYNNVREVTYIYRGVKRLTP